MSFRYERHDLTPLLRTPQMRALPLRVAADGAAFAQSISPRRTGDYASSFEVEAGSVRVAGQQRPGARLVNTSAHAIPVEWGKHGHHVLGRTLAELRRRHD